MNTLLSLFLFFFSTLYSKALSTYNTNLHKKLLKLGKNVSETPKIIIPHKVRSKMGILRLMLWTDYK